MDKTAIKNFSIWARNKLIADITYKAGLLGVTEDGIKDALPQSTQDAEFYDIGTKEPYAIHGEEIKQRKELVAAIKRKASQLDYKDAYRNVVEEVAYTWFNRLIAIRFMEVNDYMPSHIRALSSDSRNKLEPDLVTTPFDAELEFTQAETEKIMQMKNDNQVDALFRFLFIKQCNALNACLPKLFEKTSDYTELLLNVSVTDQDGIVYHLTHDIKEDDFNISNIGEDGKPTGQVEIIGWMYQYYNTEPKDEAFALLKKNVKITKERIPAATQLFTPDWIVRYMVENSVGRLWLEGHEDNNLKDEWKYYLDEAEQEADVAEQLRTIREEYKNIKLEEIKVIDPCMGSGHILVYTFDVLMQIYESYGYSQRDAAKSIVENNIYGLDIDDRAFQLAYFAIMMKARSYNRRFLALEIEPNLCAIQESNGLQYEQDMGDFLLSEEYRETLKYLLDIFVDAKEYGSILNVEKRDYDGFLEAWKLTAEASLGNVVMMLWYNECNQTVPILAKQAKIFAQIYDVVVTNPPYMGGKGMTNSLSEYVKKFYPNEKADMFAVFVDVCMRLVKKNGYYALITQPSILTLLSFENIRTQMINQNTISSLIHFGRGIFGIDFGSTTYVVRNSVIESYKAQFFRPHERTFQYIEPSDIRDFFLEAKCNHDYVYDFSKYHGTQGDEELESKLTKIYYEAKPQEFLQIPTAPIAYWVSEAMYDAFRTYKPLSYYAEPKQGMATADNNRFLRFWSEVRYDKISFGCQDADEALATGSKWFPYNKGGAYRKWYGNNDYVLNWENDGKEIREFKGSVLRNVSYYFKSGLTWSSISAGAVSFRKSEKGFLFDSKGPMCYPKDECSENYLLAFVNSKVASHFLKILAPTMDYNQGPVGRLPFIISEEYKSEIEDLAEKCIALAREDWDDKETSWDFTVHPFVKYKCDTLEDTYAKWVQVCKERHDKMKQYEERINSIFIELYGLANEITAMVEDKDISVAYADKESDIKSFLSYAVGCMLGRYGLDNKGILYAGGDNGSLKSDRNIDKDNCIIITDEEYMKDDIIGKFVDFVSMLFGNENLDKNLDFIAEAIKGKGISSKEKIRIFYLKEFFKDHCKCYQKRPIYWLFESGKHDGIKVLIYLHRYNADTIGNLRVDYLHRMERIYESEINRMQDTIDNSSNAREVTAAAKRKEKLQKQLKECQEYDEKIGHLALSRIEIDLDDGVKVNYEKVQTANDGKKYQVLAKI